MIPVSPGNGAIIGVGAGGVKSLAEHSGMSQTQAALRFDVLRAGVGRPQAAPGDRHTAASKPGKDGDHAGSGRRILSATVSRPPRCVRAAQIVTVMTADDTQVYKEVLWSEKDRPPNAPVARCWLLAAKPVVQGAYPWLRSQGWRRTDCTPRRSRGGRRGASRLPADGPRISGTRSGPLPLAGAARTVDVRLCQEIRATADTTGQVCRPSRASASRLH